MGVQNQTMNGKKITILRLSSINYSTTWSSSAAAAAGSKIPKLDNR